MKLHNLFYVIQLWKLSTIQLFARKIHRASKEITLAKLDLVMLVIELGLLFKL